MKQNTSRKIRKTKKKPHKKLQSAQHTKFTHIKWNGYVTAAVELMVVLVLGKMLLLLLLLVSQSVRSAVVLLLRGK